MQRIRLKKAAELADMQFAAPDQLPQLRYADAVAQLGSNNIFDTSVFPAPDGPSRMRDRGFVRPEIAIKPTTDG